MESILYSLSTLDLFNIELSNCPQVRAIHIAMLWKNQLLDKRMQGGIRIIHDRGYRGQHLNFL